MSTKQKVCALIAVRLKSERLPKKALMDIEGYTVIERVVNNLKPSKRIDDIVIATTISKEDDPIEETARRKGIHYFRGDIDNIVKRFIDAAEKFTADTIVRVTGDNPLTSFEIADYLIESHQKCGADYTGIEPDSVPPGTSPEIISLAALKKLTSVNVNLNYSEYMTFYFKNNPDSFRINIVPAPKKYCRPDYRMTLDYPEDLNFFRIIYGALKPGDKAIPLEKTIHFLDTHPEVVSINNALSVKWKANQELIRELENATKIKN